jgi:serine/threonine-protein kinase
MTRCAQCGEEMAEGARFCASCGKPAGAFTELPTGASTPRRPQRSGSPSPGKGRTGSGPAADAGRFAPGQELGERYRIIGLLGRGGMGEVYRADDLKLGQPVALKFLPEALARDEFFIERFHGEVRNARQVSHPNVGRVYDIGEIGGRPFLSMEYVDGEDLASLLRRIGRLPPAKAVEIARQLCAGLAAAHDKGVLHRDLKPSNIMIDGEGRARITDFGLAMRPGDATDEGMLVGTPAYMAPEQLSGRPATAKSDLYSLGLVFYEIFTGRKTFEATTFGEWKRKHEEEEPRAPSSLVADIEPAAERVILRCLQKDPRARPASALAIAAALPGGDPLAAALAAGRTPSPELVAAAGETEGFQPRIAVACLAFIVAAIVAICALSDKVSITGIIPLPNPPDVLAVKAHDLIQQFGYTAPAVDSASGFINDYDYLRYIEEHDKSPDRWEQLKSGNPSAIRFWYRESPRELEVEKFFDQNDLVPASVVSPDDPARNVSGMAYAVLDPSGRLEYIEAVPPQLDPEKGGTVAADWPALFKAARLDIAQFKPAEPEWAPPQWSDTRAAWTGAAPLRPGVPLRVEAASYRGKPVYFQLVWPWARAERVQVYPQTAQTKVWKAVTLALFTAILAGAVLVARRNLRLGRGDRRGAFRMAVFVLLTFLAGWVITAHHVLASYEFGLFVMGSSYALFYSALVWLLYIGLEPYVRRHWPNSIISWSRMLAGQFRDPLVGRDVLMGVTLGMALVLEYNLQHFAEGWFGKLPPEPWFADVLPGARGMLGQLLAYRALDVGVVLAYFFLFFLLRLLLRKDWIAATVFVLIFAGARAWPGDYPLIDGVFFATAYGIMIFVMLRFGLVPVIASFISLSALEDVPLTTHLSAWYAVPTFFSVLFVLALAIYGFRVSLAGRPILSGAAFDE